MFIILIVVACVFVLFCLLLLSKVNVYVHYERKEKEDKGEILITGLGGLIHYKLSIPMLDFKNAVSGIKVESQQETTAKNEKEESFISLEKIHSWYEKYEVMLHRIQFFHETVRRFLSRVHCEKWNWETIVGTGDAAEAGVVTGIVWGVKTNVLGFISHYIQWDHKPNLEVIPSFQHSILQTTFESKFSFSIGSVIRFFIVLWFHRLPVNTKQVTPAQKESNI